MQLLVSVRSVHEALTALDGGADIIDAKEPLAGALGRVSLPVFAEIMAGVGDQRPVSAALGDLSDAQLASDQAHAFTRAGATFVKIGFAGITSDSRVGVLLAAATAGAGAAGGSVVAVAYADYEEVGAPSPDAIVRAADRSGARGVLLDTAVKRGRALLQLMPAPKLRQWVSRAQAGGLSVALAGRIALEDFPSVMRTGAEIVGVRGAACDGGRDGVISRLQVRRLRAALEATTRRRSTMADLVEPSGGSRDRR